MLKMRENVKLYYKDDNFESRTRTVEAVELYNAFYDAKNAYEEQKSAENRERYLRNRPLSSQELEILTDSLQTDNSSVEVEEENEEDLVF